MNRLGAFLFCLLMLSTAALAGNWPQWRGPAFNGSSAETNLPEKLDKPLWTADLPGHGASTPIILDDRIFLTSIDRSTQNLTALCLDRKSGKTLWSKVVGAGFASVRNNDMASPSAIADRERVYFFFGSGDLAAFDLDGKPLWSHHIQKEHGNFNVQFIYGATPLLYKGKLFVQVLQRERPYGQPAFEAHPESYLLAYDAATGKQLWKHIRPTQATGESKESYCTPIPFEGNVRSEIVVIGGDCLSGHDPDTGKEYWRCGGWNESHQDNLRIVPSVVVADGLFIGCGPKVRGYVFAVRPGGNGDITSTHIAWQNKDIASDVPTPLYYQNNLYVLDGDFKKGLSCLDPKTGQRKWFTPLESRRVFRASPTGSDGKIYLMNENGDAWVLSASDGKILSQAALGSEGTARATIVPAQGMLFVRTGEKLYAFTKE